MAVVVALVLRRRGRTRTRATRMKSEAVVRTPGVDIPAWTLTRTCTLPLNQVTLSVVDTKMALALLALAANADATRR